MTVMNLTVPEDVKAFIDAQLAKEGYASASDYLLAEDFGVDEDVEEQADES